MLWCFAFARLHPSTADKLHLLSSKTAQCISFLWGLVQGDPPALGRFHVDPLCSDYMDPSLGLQQPEAPTN